jgi:hypothetical protein
MLWQQLVSSETTNRLDWERQNPDLVRVGASASTAILPWWRCDHCRRIHSSDDCPIAVIDHRWSNLQHHRGYEAANRLLTTGISLLPTQL